MPRAWPFLLAACTGCAAFFLGRSVGQRPIAALQAQLDEGQRSHVIEGEPRELVATAPHMFGSVRPPTTNAAPPGIAAPSSLSREDEIKSLMERLETLMPLSVRTDTDVERDDKAEHEASAKKLRDDFVTKANLDEQQKEAITPIVSELDRTLKEPLEKLAKLEDGEYYANSEWAEARAQIYTSIARSEQDLRALLSPQQRTALDETNFSLAGQLDESSYSTLANRGIVEPMSDIVEDEPQPMPR